MNIIIINEKNKNYSIMHTPRKFKREAERKRFFRQDNRLLRISSSIIKKFDGNNEEKLGQFEIFSQSGEFQKKYPDPRLREDLSTLVRLILLGY